MCRQEEEARDLVQRTYLKAFERFESFRPDTNCKAWLMKILRNSWIDEMRHRKVAGPQVQLDESLVAEPAPVEKPVWSDAGEVLENFGDEHVVRALAELPEQHRLTLFLADVEEFSQEEIAEITGVAVGTVKSRTSRARAILREKLLAHAKDLGLVGRD